MHVTVSVPERQILEVRASKVRADGDDGSFCLRPNHIDYATPLAVGIMTVTDEDGDEWFVAVDHGWLVKQGAEVRVSVRRAVHDDDLSELESTVRETYRHASEEERQARRASARLQADFVRRFLELREAYQ